MVMRLIRLIFQWIWNIISTKQLVDTDVDGDGDHDHSCSYKWTLFLELLNIFDKNGKNVSVADIEHDRYHKKI